MAGAGKREMSDTETGLSLRRWHSVALERVQGGTVRW